MITTARMASALFHVHQHIVPCPRIPKAGEIGPETVYLAVKQYSPLHTHRQPRNQLTIIAAHANGFAKELYEPLWCHLWDSLISRGIGIASIWMTDAAYQGESLSLNKSSQFSDVAWQDHSEDLICVMKHFRHEIKQPIVGVGHSMGGCQIATLSVVHRRIFSTMVLLDPAIGPPDHGLHALGLEKLTLRRKTTWPSQEAAEVWARKGFRTWDSDVVDLFLKHAIKPVAGDDSSVTLTTGNYQELINYLKPRFIHDNNVKDHPEILYQTGLVDMFHMLGLVTCSTLFLCGGKSSLSVPSVRKLWLSQISEKGYSKLPGEKRRSKVAVIPHVGHFLVMEDPKACAEALATWINDESSGWELGSSAQEKMKRQNHAALRRASEEWMESLRTKL